MTPSATGPGNLAFAARARLLIIDDDDAVRSVVARSLRHLGYPVVECQSGESAVALIGADPDSFDLVVCDTVLGGMNGDETARLIARANPKLPVITMSGYPRDRDGAVPGVPLRYFIAKPFRVQVLSTLIQEALVRA
jgi:two-component system, cell cycle sensor histidine kinase and response regulator CckA